MYFNIMQTQAPAIIISAFNRPTSLERLLNSLQKIIVDENIEIPLLFSIDKSKNELVKKVAENFEWKYGKKTVVQHEEHLGLKKNILFCGSLTSKYGSVIILEDDLYVSPYFYQFACEAVDAYDENDNICGISLFAPKRNDVTGNIFAPIDSIGDVYMMKVPNSWGQVWTQKHWEHFYSNISVIEQADISLPPNAQLWPDETSWKKQFYKYMILFDKYFIYPIKSLITNFADIGQHFTVPLFDYQVQIVINKKKNDYPELPLLLKYDEYYELSSYSIKKQMSQFVDYDFDVDINGGKNLDNIRSQYLLSIKRNKKSIFSFGYQFVPPEMNVLLNLGGDFYFFGRTEDFVSKGIKMKQLLQQERFFTQNVKSMIQSNNYKRMLKKAMLIFFSKFKIRHN